MIRDHVAANLGIAPDDVQEVLVSREAWMPGVTDFEYAPFSQQGGLGKARLRGAKRGWQVHQLFGDKLNTIIEELFACARSADRNEMLAA